MPRAGTCTVCKHRYRRFIDKAIASRQSVRLIASRYKISTSAIQRHKVHIRKAVAKAQEKADITTAKTVWGKLDQLVTEAEQRYKKRRGGLKAQWFREIRATIALGIKLGVAAHRQQQTYRDVTPAVLKMIEEVKE